MYFIKDKYLPPKTLNKYLKDLEFFNKLNTVGQSVLGKPIYSLQIGNGETRILIWSQMHGNEPTSTKSLIDFCVFLFNKKNQIVF